MHLHNNTPFKLSAPLIMPQCFVSGQNHEICKYKLITDPKRYFW